MAIRERLIIEVRPDGTEVTTREILRIGRAAEGTVDSIYLLRRALRTIGLGFAATEAVRLADAYTNITNRLAIVTSSTAELRNVMNELYEISQETRSSFRENAELFNRIALATRGFGLSQRELLNITRTLNKTVITAGVGVREANNALIQFSQGVAAGRLNGDELRSVLEQLPPLADIIARELGATRGELRRLGREGAITTDVIIRALQNAEEEVSALFAQTIPTVGQALTILQNAATRFIGELDQANGISRKIAASMVWLSENLDTVVRVVLSLASALGASLLLSAMSSLLRMTGLLRAAMGAGGFAGAVIVSARRAADLAATLTTQLVPALYASIRAGTIAAALFLVRLPAALFATSRAASVAAVMLLARIPMSLVAATRAGAGFIATFVRGIPAALAGLGRNLLSVGAALGRLTAGLGGALRAVLALGGALAIGSLRVLPVALAAGATALFLFRDNIRLVRGELATLGDFFRAVGEVIGPYLAGLRSSAASAFQGLSDSVSGLLDTTELSIKGIIIKIAQGVDQVIFILRGMTAAVPVFFEMLPAALKDLGVQAINAVIFAFRDGMTYLRSAIQDGVDYILGIFRAMPVQIASEASDLAGYLSTTFINDAIALARDLPGMIWDVFKSIGTGIVDIFNTTLDLINAGWGLLPDWFKDIMIQAMNGMISYVETGVNRIIRFFYNLPTNLVSAVRDGIGTVGDLFWQLVEYLRGLPAAFRRLFEAAMTAAKNKVKEGLNVIIGWLNRIPMLEIPTFDMIVEGSEDVMNMLGSIRGRLREVVDGFIRANAEGRDFIRLPRIRNPYEGAARGALDRIADIIQNGLNNRNIGAAERLGEAIGEAFNSGFEQTGPTEALVTGLLRRAEQIALDRRSDRLLIERVRQEQEAALRNPPEIERPPGTVPAGGTGIRSQRELITLQRINQELQSEYENLLMTAEARAINERMLRIEEQLRESNISLTQQEAILLAQRVVALEKLKTVAETVQSAVDTVFSSVANAIGDFIRTGELNFREFVANIVAELATLATTKFFLEPLADQVTSFITNALGQLSLNTGVLFGPQAAGEAASATALTTAATTLTTASTTLSTSGAALSASGAALSASGATLTAAGGSITAASGTLTASGGTLTAAGGALTTSATTVSTALLTSATALTTSAAALSAAAASMGLGKFLSSLPGHYNGADFVVGGRGGVDNNLVAFRATRGERVQVTPAKKSPDRPIQIVMNISTPDVGGFKRSESQLAALAARAISRGSRNT